MGFWSSLASYWRDRSAKLTDFSALMDRFAVAKSGANVSWKTALQVTTVLRCAVVLADGEATVPIRILRRDGDDDRVPVHDHQLSRLLNDEPNEWQTAVEFREMQSIHAALTGDAFAYKNMVRGDVRELIPFDPGAVRVKQLPDYRLAYEVTAPDGSTRTFDQSQIWHLRGASWNGWQGLDVVRLAREAIGLSMATEEAHARLHANGVQLSGLLSVEGNLTDDQHKKMMAWIEAHYAGVANRHKVMLLDRKSEFSQMSMSGVDAQHLETRRFQIEEICRGLGVNPIMVFVSDKNATYAGSEQQFLAHVVHTLRPRYRRLEASIRKNLRSLEDKRQGIYPKFVDTELLRGASGARAEYYAKALGAGGTPAWMTQNEVRAAEDMARRRESWADELPRGTNPAGTKPAGTKPADSDPAPDRPSDPPTEDQEDEG